MNKKGFALTEVLVVVVFLVSIFTFIYISVIPLIGKYENLISTEKDIDIVYKLYHIRKLIMSDENRESITTGNANVIYCSNLASSTLCNKLMEQMDLKVSNTNKYLLIYSNVVNTNSISSIRNLSGVDATEIADYAEKYRNNITGKVLFLLDKDKHTIAHLLYDTL